jgi:hypothetical protein
MKINGLRKIDFTHAIICDVFVAKGFDKVNCV